MTYDQKRALALLRRGTGNANAEFRDGQEEAIRAAVERGSRLLVVKKTGWGKSFVYFIAARLVREQMMRTRELPGPALLISPLVALMRDQVRNAHKMGVKAMYLSADNRGVWPDIRKAVTEDHSCDILLVTPERLANTTFNETILTDIAERLPMLVVDEAHCLSDWGHDFRPDYRRIENLVRQLPRTTRVLATTATANQRVKDDLKRFLGDTMTLITGDLGRPSLLLQNISMPARANRMAWLAEQLRTIGGSGIIYTSSRKATRQVTYWLQLCDIAAEAYSGETDKNHPGIRKKLEDHLHQNKVKALVATIALGIGFDKPDLAFVVHYQRPGSVVGYYQQVGRAGRALEKAYATMLCGYEDFNIVEYFMRWAFPSREQVDQILKALVEAASAAQTSENSTENLQTGLSGLHLQELARRTAIERKHLASWMKILATEQPAPFVKVEEEDLDGNEAVVSTRHIPRKQGTDLWVATGEPVSEQFWKRAKRVIAHRKLELKQMGEYSQLRSGYMQYLVHALDGEIGDFKPPDLNMLPTHTDTRIARNAQTLLKRWDHELRPRLRWAWPEITFIPNEHRCEFGDTLCSLYDRDIGSMARRGFSTNEFEAALVDDAAMHIDRSELYGAARWITYIPSIVQPESDRIRRFAKRLAESLRLPLKAALRPEWDGDLTVTLKPGEAHLEYLVLTPEDPNKVLLRTDLKPRNKIRRTTLRYADRLVVRCSPELEKRAIRFLTHLAKSRRLHGPISVWKFDGPGESGNTAVVLYKSHKEAPWHSLLNSLGQAIHFSNSLQADAQHVSEEPVLLVNDLLDHGWAFAYASAELRKAGCRAVLPFALVTSEKW